MQSEIYIFKVNIIYIYMFQRDIFVFCGVRWFGECFCYYKVRRVYFGRFGRTIEDRLRLVNRVKVQDKYLLDLLFNVKGEKFLN